MTTLKNEADMSGCGSTPEMMADELDSTPAEVFAEALDICDLREGLGTTQEMPAVPMVELVAASTYKDESLTAAMWQRAVDHIEASLEVEADVEEVAVLRSSDVSSTLSEVPAIEDEVK